MSASFVNAVKISSSIELVLYLANKWIEHQAEEAGTTVEEALETAKDNYLTARAENEDLKDLGH